VLKNEASKPVVNPLLSLLQYYLGPIIDTEIEADHSCDIQITFWPTRLDGITLKNIILSVVIASNISKLKNLLDSRIADGVDVVSVTCRPPLTQRKVLGTHFVRG
jgi:hypothetical protein